MEDLQIKLSHFSEIIRMYFSFLDHFLFLKISNL